MMLQACAYNSIGQPVRHKIMHFKSYFGSVSMQTPVGWKRIDVEPVSSFDVRIAIGGKDTLAFSLGFWSSLLHDGHLLSSETDNDKYVPAKKYEKKIDGHDAFTIIPDGANIHDARIYFDSLFVNSLGLITKFDFYGSNLSKAHQKLFYQVIQTLKFKKP
jgi:hypothetical protein